MRTDLLRAALAAHRRALLAWAIGSLPLLAILGAAYGDIVRRLGDAAALAADTAPLTEALRPLFGPALRLDTFGGFLSWRVLSTLPLLLGIYALIQGTRVVRGEEARGVVDQWLATGWSRAAIVRDRSLAFAGVLAVLAAVFAAGLALAAALAGQALTFGAFAWTGVEVALCAGAFFALALLVSQLVRAARDAAGLTAAVMMASFLVTNLSDRLGPLGGLRFASPFFYYQRSRPLIPGEQLDGGATLVLLLMGAGLTLLAALAFIKRDCGAPLLRFRRAAAQSKEPRLGGLAMRTLWTAALKEQRFTLLSWGAGIGIYAVLNVSIAPTVAELTERILPAFLARAGRAAIVDQYLSVGIFPFLALLVAAFVVVESGRWATDLTEGRVEMALSCPLSRSHLVLERLLALGGALVIVLAGLAAGIVVGAVTAAVDLHAARLARALAMMGLLALALGALGSALVAALRGGVVAVLSVFLGVSYLLLILAPLFGWPSWTVHLSLLDVYGQPYTAAPEAWRLLTFGGVFAAGLAAALALTRRQALSP